MYKKDISERMKALLNKRMDLNTKSIPKTVDEENRTIEYIMSTDDVDRHGEVVDQLTMKLVDSLPALLFHDHDRFPIGQWSELRVESNDRGGYQLVGKLNFSKAGVSDESDQAWEQAKAGDIRTISIGFIPHRIEYDEEKDVIVLYDCELLEGSLVNVPANKFAVAKSFEEKASGLTEEDRVILEKTAKLIENFLEVGEKSQVADNTEVKPTQTPISKDMQEKRYKARLKHQLNQALRKLSSK